LLLLLLLLLLCPQGMAIPVPRGKGRPLVSLTRILVFH
jgi:hypothetical protein